MLIVLLIFLLSGCNADSEQLSVNIKPSYLTIWKQLVSNNPLPPGIQVKIYTYSGDTSSESKNLIYIRRDSWRKKSAAMKPDGSTAKMRFIKKKVKTVFFAPAVRLWDPRQNISFKYLFEIASQKDSSGDLKILPLKNIRLPWRAVSVGHRYPFQPGYPLADNYFLLLRSSVPVIAAWFNSLKTDNSGKRIVWIGAVGDMMLARGTDKTLLRGRQGSRGTQGLVNVFGSTLPILKNTDFLMGNLECVASLKGKKAKKRYHFHFNPLALKKISEAGFNYVSLANNHSLDYGIEGFRDALKNLKDEKIGFSGAGGNLKEASMPFEVKVGGEKLQIYSAGAYPVESSGFDGRKFTAAENSPGILWANKYFLNLLKRTFSKKTFDIVMVHGGREWTSVPTEKQKKLYRSMIDSGADLIIGSHPHYLQGLEVYRQKLIAYSLGNFIFPGMEGTAHGEESIILKAGLYHGNLIYINIYPVVIHGSNTRLAENDLIKKRFLRLTEALNRTR